MNKVKWFVCKSLAIIFKPNIFPCVFFIIGLIIILMVENRAAPFDDFIRHCSA